MSFFPCADPNQTDGNTSAVDQIIIPRMGDIGGFKVHRALPSIGRKMVGPFIFWDQMGPGEFLTGQGVDVRPHPHIGLSTVTYLFDGSMDHKDSLGNTLRIQPGELNLMSAGAGIVHSERTGQDVRKAPSKLFGIQSWIAQPKHTETADPRFLHAEKADLPTFTDTGVHGRLILGSFHGEQSHVDTDWDTLYIDLALDEGAKVVIPKETEERAIYILQGKISLGNDHFEHHQLLVLRPGENVTIKAESAARMMVLGGAAMDGPRHIWWNFVASSRDLLEAAKTKWKNREFPRVPGDEDEFIPLPEK